MNRILVITCGKVIPDTPDPEMTREEREKLASIRRIVPYHPAKIVCGLGTRHLQIPKILGININTNNLEINPIAGTPVVFYEKLSGMEKVNTGVMQDGRSYPKKCFKNSAANTANILRFVCSLPNNSIVCTEVFFLKYLGVENPRGNSVYEVVVNRKTTQSIRIIV